MIVITYQICQQPCAGITLFDSKHSQITRNQKGNQVNIPTVRTKTSGANSIKSKSVNTWNGSAVHLIQQHRAFLALGLPCYEWQFTRGYLNLQEDTEKKLK